MADIFGGKTARERDGQWVECGGNGFQLPRQSSELVHNATLMFRRELEIRQESPFPAIVLIVPDERTTHSESPT